MALATEPIRIGNRICKNRITMAPTVKFAAGPEGMVTEEFVKHYEERAAHGVGLIVVEATCVSPEGRLHPTQLGLWEDSQIEGHRKIVEAVHAHDALILPQIHYGGLGTHPECGPLTSPTKVTWNSGWNEAEAVELTHAEIKRIIQCFIDAAIRAKKAGYDGVQLHACHAYIINDFASNVNQRTDEYGGSLGNRARFGCEVIAGIRKACGEDFIISARISGADPTIEESARVAEMYVSAGCDYLQVSSGIGSIEEVELPEDAPYNRIAALGIEMHKHFAGRIPVSTVNGIRNAELARYLVENELVDTVDLGCGLLADPAFSEAILYGKEYVACLNCKDCGFGPGHPHLCGAMKKRGAMEFPSVFQR